IIFSGAGLPLELPGFLNTESTTKLVPIVSSGRAAKIICQKWKSSYDYLPDAFVVEGPKAGGHLGFKKDQIYDDNYSLEELIPEVVNEVEIFEEQFEKKIPVIAAGGIYTSHDIHEIMSLGATAVQLGSRFVTTLECDASPAFKQAYINANEADMRIIASPVGMPGRAIMNDFIKKINEGLKTPVSCPYHCIKTCNAETSPYCIMAALYNAFKGNMDKGYAFAGSNAYRADKVSTVKEVFEELSNGI
ncbi:MAG TPA: nitronate monooxygenase family protein, partial [Prolixibacteraceae bacterium]|nr:nitronate monooxygenase family protein [Prolixibacteraceae bacterium]